LNGCPSEDVPGGDQDLAGDGGLGGVGLAVAALDVGTVAIGHGSDGFCEGNLYAVTFHGGVVELAGAAR
jgi:hypothetical protein